MDKRHPHEVRLVGERNRTSWYWQWWELVTRVEEPGAVTLKARAGNRSGWPEAAGAGGVEPSGLRQ